MKKKISKNKFTEKIIINNYLKKLNFNKQGTFNFENDASYIKLIKNKKLVVTSDSISENLDFFKYDDPKSIAKKIVTINLSDLSAMGTDPYAYSLNLFLPRYINHKWINLFTKELYALQKKYNFYLLGGDLSRSDKLHISSTFFGLSKSNKIIRQNKINFNYDIWITGNLGDSFVGLQILKKKIDIINIKTKNYFLKRYFYPKPCMIGPKLSNYVESMKDISDGFISDLKKMLDKKHKAEIDINKIPISKKLEKILKQNLINQNSILNTGDNYDLIMIAQSKNREKIFKISHKNKVKVSLVGKISKKFKLINDSDKTLNIPKEFDHFR